MRIKIKFHKLACMVLLAAAALPIWGYAGHEAGMTAIILDIKYSRDSGVQICEVQTVSRSRFRGSDFAHNSEAYVGDRLVPLLTAQFDHVWYRSGAVTDPGVRRALNNVGAHAFKDVKTLESNRSFRDLAKRAVADPSDLSMYSGLVYLRGNNATNIESLRSKYPGVIWLDADVWKSTESKAKMNALFRSDALLKNFKPRSKSYTRKYDKKLARTIMKEVGKDLLVIKPLNAVKGRGVIVVKANELDKTLKTILSRNRKLQKHSDPEYRYWYGCKDKSFVVEDFALSDPVRVEHLKWRPYDGTMRAVVLLSYDRGEVYCDLVDTYWKLPEKSLTEKGELTELHKSCGALPYFAEVDRVIEAEVDAELAEALPRLYTLLKGVAA